MAIRVLHLVPSFAGGGAERQLAYLVSALADDGMEVHVAYVHGGPNQRLLEEARIELHALAATGNHDPLLFNKARALMRRIRPDLVQTWLLQMDVMAGAAAVSLSIPWVLSERASAGSHAHGWKNYLRRRVGQRANAIVANSSVGLEYWMPRPASQIHRVIRNIVPIERILDQPIADPHGETIPTRDDLIVAAGRFEPEKNWMSLIAAAGIALERLPNARFVAFGAGTLRESMLQAISEHPVSDRMHVLDYTDELWGWLKRAKVYVTTSRHEGSPNVLLEAIVCGCSIVASDIDGHREILGQDDARLVQCDDPEAIAEGLVNGMLNARGDCGSNARPSRELLSGWSAQAAARQYTDLYTDVLAR